MEYVYIVEHLYDVDGGFGDAVGTSDILGVFSSEAEAAKYVEKYSHKVVYDQPYADLCCGELTYRAVPIWFEATSAPEFRLYVGHVGFNMIKPYGSLESDEEAIKKYEMTFYRDWSKEDDDE